MNTKFLSEIVHMGCVQDILIKFRLTFQVLFEINQFMQISNKKLSVKKMEKRPSQKCLWKV